jgi:hypothetical protein
VLDQRAWEMVSPVGMNCANLSFDPKLTIQLIGATKRIVTRRSRRW